MNFYSRKSFLISNRMLQEYLKHNYYNHPLIKLSPAVHCNVQISTYNSMGLYKVIKLFVVIKVLILLLNILLSIHHPLQKMSPRICNSCFRNFSPFLLIVPNIALRNLKYLFSYSPNIACS